MRKTKVRQKKVYKGLTKKVQKKRTLDLSRKLTREEQIQVITWFVELKTMTEIQELIKENFCKEISRSAIWSYSQRKKWKKVIKRLRDRYEASLLKIPIANKVDRLRFLQKIVDEGLTRRVVGYSKYGDKIWKLELGAVVRAVDLARTEMEGNKSGIEIKKHTHFAYIDTSGLKGKSRQEMIDIIMGRNKGFSREG